MNSKTKKILLGVCVLAVAGLLIWAVAGQQTKTDKSEKNIRVEVVHKDGETASFEYSTEQPFLGPLLLEEDLIEGDSGSYGLFVTEVDGEKADFEKDGGWWKLSVNGQDSETGADSVPVEDGAVYTWTYEGQ